MAPGSSARPFDPPVRTRSASCSSGPHDVSASTRCLCSIALSSKRSSASSLITTTDIVRTAPSVSRCRLPWEGGHCGSAIRTRPSYDGATNSAASFTSTGLWHELAGWASRHPQALPVRHRCRWTSRPVGCGYRAPGGRSGLPLQRLVRGDGARPLRAPRVQPAVGGQQSTPDSGNQPRGGRAGQAGPRRGLWLLRGQPDRALAMLIDLRPVANAVGGSHAQRDIIDLTLIAAAARAGERTLTEDLVAERVARKPSASAAATQLVAANRR